MLEDLVRDLEVEHQSRLIPAAASPIKRHLINIVRLQTQQCSSDKSVDVVTLSGMSLLPCSLSHLSIASSTVAEPSSAAAQSCHRPVPYMDFIGDLDEDKCSAIKRQAWFLANM